VHAADAQRRAADRVTVHQLTTVALPRRFSLPMQEIWLLQARLSQRQPKRVTRLLAHPRFRAAYDFLVLRQFASNEHAEEVTFWTHAQTLPREDLAVQPDAQAGEDNARDADAADTVETTDGAPRKRRRRRRRPVASESIVE
jgi:poly(A) polymerase